MPNSSQSLQQQLNFEFSPQSYPIQIEIINGDPHFSVKDVCDVLDLQNPSDIVAKTLDKDEYLPYTVYRSGQEREMLFVTESGLYSLIFQSRKPEAKRFRKWVTSEVLPSIRKTGGYSKYNIASVQSIEQLLPYTDQVQHKGQTLYAAIQLLTILGKSVSNKSPKLIALQKEGLACKLPGGKSGMTKWYIARPAIGRLLNVRPNSLQRIEIIKQLKKGGML